LLLHVHVQVMTIEPGVYIPASPVLNERAPGRFRGIGIRIEDEVLVTEDGHEVRAARGVAFSALPGWALCAAGRSLAAGVNGFGLAGLTGWLAAWRAGADGVGAQGDPAPDHPDEHGRGGRGGRA